MNNNSTAALSPQKTLQYRKLRILALSGFVLFPLAYLFLHSYSSIHPMAFALLNLSISMYFILNWFYLDVALTQYQGSPHKLAVGIVLFAAFAIPYYIFKSRPKQKRTHCILIMLSLFVLNTFITTSCLSFHT
jgi:hypothetical protein